MFDTLAMGAMMLRRRARLTAVGAVAGVMLATYFLRKRRQRAKGQVRPLRTRWAYVGLWRIYCRVGRPIHRPSSVPVVLIHGFGMSGSYLMPTAKRLARFVAVYVPDLPGHGKSDTPSEPLDIPTFADALIGWMNALWIERASLLGNSMGCQIAVDAALRYPTRVHRLVLVGPTVDPAVRSARDIFKRLLLTAVYERPSLHVLVARDYRRMGKRLLRELRFMLWDPVEVKLPDIVVPTLLVRGAKDRVASQQWLDEVARLVRADRVVVIPRRGHALSYSAARELVSAIVPFLEDSPTPSQPIVNIDSTKQPMAL
jgi:2-hydroxy-6-oxonona-2,4-dienedioate hydrolase